MHFKLEVACLASTACFHHGFAISNLPDLSIKQLATRASHQRNRVGNLSWTGGQYGRRRMYLLLLLGVLRLRSVWLCFAWLSCFLTSL